MSRQGAPILVEPIWTELNWTELNWTELIPIHQDAEKLRLWIPKTESNMRKPRITQTENCSCRHLQLRCSLVPKQTCFVWCGVRKQKGGKPISPASKGNKQSTSQWRLLSKQRKNTHVGDLGERMKNTDSAYKEEVWNVLLCLFWWYVNPVPSQTKTFTIGTIDFML
jgi:hypothetical protein